MSQSVSSSNDFSPPQYVCNKEETTHILNQWIIYLNYSKQAIWETGVVATKEEKKLIEMTNKTIRITSIECIIHSIR